jgi:alanine dehydrogenase
MRVGVPKEIKVLENRVGLTPASVHELVTHGHDVVVESNAGQGIGLDDAAYRRRRRSPQAPMNSLPSRT